MIVLIPAYQPGPALVAVVHGLAGHRVVVVDDGSGPAYAAHFRSAAALGARVITLPHNRGKGAALKAGFAHIARHHPGEPVVCADSDGQHAPADIERVALALEVTDADMVLGARRFTGAVPARSRIGNALTCKAFALATGRSLIDTQTGLRAYPARRLEWLLQQGGDRFEYELRLLLCAARQRLRIEEVEIATIYLDENASSHFRPLVDSARIYLPLLAFALSSLIGFTLDAVVLFALASLTGQLVLSAVVARVVSGAVNFTVNRRWVFAHDGDRAPRARSLLRYVGLAAAMLLVNLLLLESLYVVTGSLVAAKVLTELSLFVASFTVQRHVVFAHGRPSEPVRVSAPTGRLVR